MHPPSPLCSPSFGLPCGGTFTSCSPFHGGASTTHSAAFALLHRHLQQPGWPSLGLICHFMSVSGLIMPRVPTPQVLRRELFQPQLAGLMLAVPSVAGAVPTTGSTPLRLCTS